MSIVPDLSSRPFSFTMKRNIPLSTHELYLAWTERIDVWFAMPGSVSMRAEVDAPFYFVTENEHMLYPHYGRFLRLESDRLVEITWVTGIGGTNGAETVVTIELNARDDGTDLHLRHAGFADEHSKKQHADAWHFVLHQLEQRLSELE